MLERLIAYVLVIGALVWVSSELAGDAPPLDKATLDEPSFAPAAPEREPPAPPAAPWWERGRGEPGGHVAPAPEPQPAAPEPPAKKRGGLLGLPVL
ncbi:MAG TPA: hypothetical protein VM370_08265 [Candidatus Thermoplasmatota archaeon]|nr:hypothetical protein [Candidatus Thermoplasmatota archaeon]